MWRGRRGGDAAGARTTPDFRWIMVLHFALLFINVPSSRWVYSLVLQDRLGFVRIQRKAKRQPHQIGPASATLIGVRHTATAASSFQVSNPLFVRFHPYVSGRC